MNPNRYARMGFSHSILLANGGIPIKIFTQIFNYLPNDARISGMGQHGLSSSIDYLLIQSDCFKEVAPSLDPPDIVAKLKTEINGETICTGVDMSAALESQAVTVNLTVTLPPRYEIDFSKLDLGPANELKKKGCQHVWAWWPGPLDSYEYCKTCGDKK